MTEADTQIGEERGSIKPDGKLTDIVRQVASNRNDGKRGSLQAASNGALLDWLAMFAHSEHEEDRRILNFVLRQEGYDSFDDFAEDFAEKEPVMSASATVDGVAVSGGDGDADA